MYILCVFLCSSLVFCVASVKSGISYLAFLVQVSMSMSEFNVSGHHVILLSESFIQVLVVFSSLGVVSLYFPFAFPLHYLSHQ